MCISFITEELDINFTVARMVILTQKRPAHDHACSIYHYGVQMEKSSFLQCHDQ